MNRAGAGPRLLVHVTVSGDSGSLCSLTLADGATRLGRDPASHVVLRNRFISAHHAEIRIEGGRVMFHDLRSTNGSRIRRNRWIIEVDFARDHEIELEDGDEILLGDKSQPVQVRVTVAVPAGDPSAEGGPTIVQAVRRDEMGDLARRIDHATYIALSELSASLGPREAPATIGSKLVTWLLGHFPKASHVAVHIVEPATSQLRRLASGSRSGGSESPVVSAALQGHVLQTGKALVFVGEMSPSLHDASIREGLCAPLAVGDEVFGLVQVDRRDGDLVSRFRRSDLELVAVAARHVSLALELGRMHESYRSNVETAIRGIIAVIESRDEYMAGHSAAVADLSRRLARRLHLPEDFIERVGRAGALHDIGRFGIPGEILNNPSDLTPEQLLRVRAEPEVGASLLERFGFLDDLVPIVRHVHERWDGAGYPAGLAAENIPLGARIVAVADAFHTVVSHRSYRAAMTQAEALEQLARGSGCQFDPRVVGVLEEILGVGDDAWEVGMQTSIGLTMDESLLAVLKK